MKKLILSMLITATLAAQPVADGINQLPPETVAAIDSHINKTMEAKKIPGVAVGVVRDGQLVFAKGYGLANIEHQIPVTPQTMFQSGSVGKAFTVMAVMMLAEDGKIDIEAPVKTYFPDAPAAWDKIRVRHLLEHTSGMGGYPNDLDFRKDYTEGELFEMFKKQPLAFEPGAQRGYSNVAFSILGMLINKVTGKFHGEFLRERIFEPLEMTTARVISESDIVSNRASGYMLVDQEIKNQEWVAPSHNTDAAGALYLSLLDMAKWEAALNSGKLLSKAGYEKMWSPIVTADAEDQPWGMSWNLYDRNGHRIIRHSGGWQGFTANFSRYPEKKVAVIVFTNMRGANPSSLSFGVEAIVSPELSLAGAVPIKNMEPKMDARITKLVHGLIVNNPDKALLTDSAANEIAEHGEKASAELRSYGRFKNADLIVRKEIPGGKREFHHRLNFEKKQLMLMTWVDQDNKVYDLFVERE